MDNTEGSRNQKEQKIDQDNRLLHETLSHGTSWTTISALHVPRRTTLAIEARYSRLGSKQENKRKRRKSPARSKFDRLPISETSEEDVTETSFTFVRPLYQNGKCQAEQGSGLHERRDSDAMHGGIDDMASDTSTMGCVTFANVEPGASRASICDASNDGCYGTATDDSPFSRLCKSNMEFLTDGECQSPHIHPRIPLEPDPDLSSIMTNPFAPQTQAFALGNGIHL